MDRAQVISVNPGVKTKGELMGNYERLARISRSLCSPVVKKVPALKRVLNIVFGINPKMTLQTSAKMLLLRLVCGSLMILSILLPMAPDDILQFEFGPHAIVMCALGVSLVLGVFTRLTSFAGAGWFGYHLVLSMMAVQPDVTAGSLCLLLLVFSVLGPGIFSTDQLMRLGILSIRKRILLRRKTRRQKKSGEAMLTYRAYATASTLNH